MLPIPGNGRPEKALAKRLEYSVFKVQKSSYYNDLWDTRGDSFWAIWTLMRESPHEFTTREFYDAWMNRWGSLASVACRYYNNTIDYGARPIYRVRLPLILNQ